MYPSRLWIPTCGEYDWLLLSIQFNNAPRSIVDPQCSRSTCVEAQVVCEE